MHKLASHAEDIALVVGATVLSVGMALTFSVGPALICAGLLLVAYGVWITDGRG
jgi:tryptophan-rich sensory protein